ncbi:MAG: 30S ribosomal protein S15 [Calditrichaeota bacterium]|nr:30S ribosomal protein S15 [Candidatus Cloacimonadota bacterium]MCB1046162.1 30S ribosomal protein S15 [Calditrichota bacterium]MCB9473046.1 30S ribosomal protein S15 [Candidatus Delongbacteria bacterium]
MSITRERTAELCTEYGAGPQDTGNTKVQIAVFTERIRNLTEHAKSNPKDHHSTRGLLMLVGKRRRLLNYLMSRDLEGYRTLIQQLGLRR